MVRRPRGRRMPGPVPCWHDCPPALSHLPLFHVLMPSHPKTDIRAQWICLCLLALAFALPSAALASKRKPKPANSEMAPPEPDPLTRRARPDSHPRTLEQPAFFGFTHQTATLHGIDVSHYQGRIDWDCVARHPEVSYVYIKASEGESNQDSYYQTNVREARRAGLKVGSYHFFRANVTAQKQLSNFMSMVDLRQQDLIPIIDVEATNRVSDDVFHARLKELLRLVTQTFGKRPMIYTGRNFYNKHFYGKGYGEYPFMIAAYIFEQPQLSGGDDYVIWQYTASGRIDGVRGDVDRSRFVGRHSLRDITL